MTDQSRVSRLKSQMRKDGLDALVLRLPENIVMLFGVWPMNGISHALFTAADGPVALIAPSCEDPEMDGCWATDIRYFAWPRLVMDDPAAFTQTQLQDLARKHGLTRARIGYEGAFEAVAPAHNAGEVLVPCEPTIAAIKATLPKARWIDATGLLQQQRATKTPGEVEKLRTAHRVAAFGLRAFHETVAPGLSEAALAGIVYRACLERGVGVRGVQHVNVYPQISSGRNASRAWRPVVTTGKRKLKDGEVAVLELAVCVDGFWADVTRVKVAGKPQAVQLDAFRAVRAAQQAALDTIRAGVMAKLPHETATAVLIDYGFADSVVHLTGHGLGFRYHEPEPFLMPGNKMRLRAGHVCSVEPGLYDPSWGGIRLEDNIVVTKESYDNLTTAKKTL